VLPDFCGQIPEQRRERSFILINARQFGAKLVELPEPLLVGQVAFVGDVVRRTRK
jgi:hypothetical protein